ncbi:MAG: hypothetical protein A2Y25_10690 [Candidatus Melainabacteria bacterium GWF2_37_15]|nr:MAG: hypothetical protein A2Y25_10690 [Candidatus Melainabacteria bacterium GWF2_37_15]
MLDFFGNILDYFFYKKCYLCGNKAEFGSLCGNCFEKIKAKSFKKTKNIKGVPIYGYFSYEGELKKLIRGIKYHDKRDLAATIAKILADSMDLKEDIEIIPVPMHNERQKKRKYNHIELIASQLGLKVNTNLIKRVKDTKAQYHLSSKERKDNLQDAFQIFPEKYSGKKLVLFDDICTTGATMEELISELRKNNINNIAGLVICFTALGN